MTVDAARRRGRRTHPADLAPEPMIAPPASIVIGELEQTIFECPSCSRPLALGARRCPACRTRLVRGVALGKASGFVAIGLAVGLLAGAGGGVVFGITHGGGPAPTRIGAGASTAPASGSNGHATASMGPHPTATTTAGSTATSTTDPAGMPSVTRSALIQVVVANGRLAEADDGLRAALGARTFDASAVAQILRSVSADSIFGQQVAGHVADWSGSSAVGAQLVTFYATVHETAANGLVSSVQNQGAYRAAAHAMVKVLGEIPALDAAVGQAARSAGIDLPGASAAPPAP